jgi:hypothetical protein
MALTGQHYTTSAPKSALPTQDEKASGVTGIKLGGAVSSRATTARSDPLARWAGHATRGERQPPPPDREHRQKINGNGLSEIASPVQSPSDRTVRNLLERRLLRIS